MSIKAAKKLLIILLCIIFVTGLFACMLQTSTFSIKTIELKNATNTGFVIDENGNPTDLVVDGKIPDGMLFIPKTATPENPAPGICLTHGYLNNWQFQLQNAIELARRGFVVAVISQQGHGNNNNEENWPGGMMPWTKNGGIYDGAKYVYNLDCVDKSLGVGISGHSMGAEATDTAMIADGGRCEEFAAIPTNNYTTEGANLGIISAGIMQGFDPVEAVTPGGFIDFTLWNENVNVGLLKGSDDEFFYINTFPDGTPSRCRDYLQSVHAAMFTKTGYTEGDNSSVNVGNGVYYVEGKETAVTEGTAIGEPFRVIYEDAKETHPLNHFSRKGAANMVKFFYAAYGTPNGAKYIPSNSQVWWIKEALTTIALVAFFALVFPLSTLLLEIPFFADLKHTVDDKALQPLKGRKAISYFICAILCAIFAGCTFVPLYNAAGLYFPTNVVYPEDTTNPVIFWASCVGLFTLAVITVSYLINRAITLKKGEKEANPFAACVMPGGLAAFLKTILLALLTVVLMYVVLYINWGIFHTDFRVWSLDVKTFDIAMFLPIFVRYLPLFAIFYCINAFANSTYRVSNLPEWASILINALFNVAGVVGVIWVNYAKFMATGWTPIQMLCLIVIFPLVVILPTITVISRILYKKTGNIWYGAFVNTMIVTMMTVVNTAASYLYQIV